MKITPYLESANKALDYTVVAAAHGVKEYITHARLAEDQAISAIVCREVHTPDGKLTFFSRERPAGEQYVDKLGRPIRRTDGICVSDDPHGEFQFHPDYLEQAEKINDGYFDKFQSQTERRDGAFNVTEEISSQNLPKQTEGVSVREPYDAVDTEVKKKDEPTAGVNTSVSGDTPGAVDDRHGQDHGGFGKRAEEKVGGQATEKRGLAFHAATVGLGVFGAGLMAHGILRWFLPHDREWDAGQHQQAQAGSRKPLLRLAEVGAGAGMTWGAYVAAQRSNLLKLR